MKWKSLFAAALTAAVALPAWAQDATGGGTPSLSFSFANGRDGNCIPVMPCSQTALGIHSVPVEKWIDLADEDVTSSNKAISATDVVPAGDAHANNFTLPAPVYVTYSAANGWSHASDNTRTILQAYLDDGGTNGASITVRNVPFTKYDVIVYFATDNANAKFRPVTINGTRYAWTQFGTTENPWDSWTTTNTGTLIVNADANATFGRSQQDVANLGQNAIRVDGLETQTLTIQGSTGIQNNDTGRIERCGIAAIQIIQAEDGALRETDYQHSISVNMKGYQNSIVGTAGTSGLVSVPNAYWNELSSDGTSESQFRLVDDVGLATSLSIDATYSGALWYYSSAGRPTLGDMANGYREVTTLDLSAVPYSQYDLILYYASDRDGTSEGTSAKTWAPVKITSGETVSYYTYTADHATGAALKKVDETDAADWGTTASCKDTEQSVAYGGAVMLIEGLSGDIALEMLKNDNNRGGLYGFQIVCTGELLDLVPTISVNIADVRTPNAQGGTLSNPDADVSTTGVYGLAPVPGNAWANLRPATVGTDGTETITKAYACGLATPVRVSYQASGTDEYTGTTDAPVDSFLRYYLDDGVSANGQKSGADIYVTNIPFSKYDVIVYLATDVDGEKFNPVEINGTPYKGDEAGSEEATSSTDVWGTVRQTAPALGANALRVSGLEGNLRIHGGTKQTVNGQVARGGIAAFQIVLADDGEILESVDPDRGVLSLNFNSGRNNAAVPDTNAFYGLDAVPGWAWYDSPKNYGNNGTTAITSEETVSTAYGPVLDPQPPVTISAANGYFYSSNDPFMRAYLDDNARVNISSEVPYDYYDVIVYSATDGTNSRFQAVGVNGTDYRWRDDQGKPVVAGDGELFGYGGRDAAFGQNAQRINGQTANPLTIVPRAKSGSYRGGIAAIQIIERPVQEIEVNTSMTAQEVFAQSLPGRVPKLVFAEGGAITGAVNLSGVAVDLTQVTTLPFSGNLTVDANTKLYLPNVRTYTLTTGSVTGTLAAGNVFVGGMAIPADAMTQDGANLTFNIEITYNWTGKGTDTNWSTPGNWSSHAVPTAEADVSIPLAAGDKVTIELPADAVAKSVTITGSESGAATLALTSAEGGSLTVSGQMLTTGNVTVTQSADITVRGATKTGVFYPGTQYETTQPVQAGFHVHQGTWQILSGTLSVPTDGGNLTGEAGISGDGTLIVGGEGASDAKLAVHQLSHIFYNETLSLAYGTLRVAAGGTLTASNAVSLAVNYGHTYTVDLAGGTIETPTLATFAGVTVSDDSSLRAPNGGTLNVTLPRGSSGDALTGTDGVTLSGTVTIPSELTDYTGTLTVSAGSALTLSANARPRLVLVSGATEAKTSLTVTRTDDEAESGTIVFPTTMTTEPENVTYTVSGLDEEEKKTLSVDVSEGQLTLSWEVKRPTLSTTSDWSTTDNWTNLPDGTTPTYPTSDSVTLDGTKSPITVTLNTDLSEMTYIFVKGNVTLVTTNDQPTIPACVALGEGATLTVDANFSGEWTLPAGYTLQVTKGFTSFADLTLEGAVVILSDASGTAESPTKIGAPNVEFNGGLTIDASNLTLESMFNVGKTLALNGSNITLAGGGRFLTDNGTQVVNTGSYNAITGVTGLNGSLAVNSGTLALTLAGDQPTITSFLGATIAKDATLTLAGPSGWFPATGAGTLVLEGDYRPLFSAVTVGETSATDIPAKMILSATADEQDKGLVSFQTYTGTSGEVTIPDGFVAEVKPYDEAPVWVPVCVRRNSSYIDIYNVPAPNGLTGLDDEVALTLRQAAAKEGITNGNYTVQLRTKGGQTTIASPDAATLNDVLGCFTGLKATANAEGTTLTYAYDFGIVGIKRNTTGDGWVVTAKVQGEGAAQAGFAKDNYYVLSVTAGGSEKKVQLTGESSVDETSAATGTVELTVPDTALEGLTLDDGFTLGVSVSRTAPAQ